MVIYTTKYQDIFSKIYRHYIIIKIIWLEVPLVPYPNPQKVGKIQKMLCFFLIKAKSHRPIGLAYAAVRSDSVALIQIIGRLSRLRLPCVCHTLSTPFACISHFFAGYSALKVPRINI